MTKRTWTTREVENAIASIASRQHDVITRAQLLAAGVSGDVVDRRVRTGRLRVVRRGVYLAGAVMQPYTRAMAATLACGTGAFLSHRSAAALRQIRPAGSDADVLDIIIPHDRRCRQPGIRTWRIGPLDGDEVTSHEGVPLTTPARTLLDLASVVSERELERAVAEALALRLTSRDELVAMVKRHEGHRGARRLRAVIDAETAPARTRSEAEESFLALTRRAQLPRPDVNVSVAGYEIDFFWRPARFAVEIDGFAFHSAAGRFESDRRRDAVLAAAGVQVMRVTWRQLAKEPEAVLTRVALALGRASALST